MRFTKFTRLASLIVLASFMAFLLSTSSQKALAQTATITINNYCSETIWVGAFPNIGSGTITGGSDPGAITTLGGWELDSNATATISVPDNWSGRFWGRTGCNFNASGTCATTPVMSNDHMYTISNCCDTGDCTNGSGDFALNCVQTGLPPATLAEFTLAAGGLDNYDVSMVDGGNIPVAIIPNSADYNCSTNGNCTFTGNLPGSNPPSPNCTQDSDCYPLFGNGYKWKCDPSQNLCVNPFFCGSPGCTATGGCAPNGLTQSLLPNSAWGGGNFAVSQSACNSELQLFNGQNQGTTYVGCFAPQKYCRKACSQDGDCGPPYTFNCDTSTGFCAYSDGTTIGADCDTVVSNTTNNQLWACTGVNAASCFTSMAGDNCCGCPPWAPGYPGGACIGGNNTTWQSNAEPLQSIFNNSSPTSYAFPYDDTIKLFACQTSTSGQPVNYTVNFCPNDSDGDGVQNPSDLDSDNDGIPNSAEGGQSAATVNTRSDQIGTNEDSDADGIPNYLDLDSDNDGIPDHEECGGTDDADHDGRVDSKTDANGNGLADKYDPSQGGTPLTCADTDGDGIPDFRDINSDNQDGSDYVENGGMDSDGDGLPDSTVDSNGDGLLDIFDANRGGTPLTVRDSDGDGIPNQLDANNNSGGGCALAPAHGSNAGTALLTLMFLPGLILLRRSLRIYR